ncbi:MAG: DUF3187 family protein [Thermoanaerobaculia bacterium]|nr:DUF3187 family protein [Thermoanaerobaculia bacterium]
MRWRHTLGITLGMAALTCFPATAQESPQKEGLRFFDTGPLRIREQFLLGQGFLAFEPTSADVLDRGRWQFDLVQNVTNTWVQSEAVENYLAPRDARGTLTLEELRAIDPEGELGLYHADGELHRSSLSIRRGLGKGLQLSLTIPVLDFQGGLADSTIEGFHDTFGLGQSGRKGIPRDRYRIYLRDPSGQELFREGGPSVGIGDISLGLKARLPAPSPSWQLAIEGQVKLPTGNEEDLYGSGAVDVGTQLLATRYYGRSCLHAGVGAIYLGANETLFTGDQVVLSAMIGWERAWGKTTSIIIQGTASQSPFRDLEIGQLKDVAYLIDIGVKKGFGQRWVTFMALSENLVNYGSSADVGLHFGLTLTR